MPLSILCKSQTNGTSDVVKMDRSSYNYRSGSIYVSGTFNGATVQLQASPDDGTTWFDVTGGSFTSKEAKELSISATHLRVDVSGGGGSESINVWLG